jgi:hypothetical protein
MRIINEGSYSADERISYREVILSNLVRGHTLVDRIDCSLTVTTDSGRPQKV